LKVENSSMTLSSRPGGHAVKKSRFTEEQIAYALKQAELGTPVAEVCRKMGISDATFYNWRTKYGGLSPLGAAPAEAT
jgi:putative transposase